MPQPLEQLLDYLPTVHWTIRKHAGKWRVEQHAKPLGWDYPVHPLTWDMDTYTEARLLVAVLILAREKGCR